MNNIKLNYALIFAMVLQAIGLIWYVSKLDSKVETVYKFYEEESQKSVVVTQAKMQFDLELLLKEMEEVRKKACSIPWVTVRKSSSGKGIHLYVFLGPKGVHTVNHHEHAALSRAILSIMSAEAGFDFCSRVDICGGNMWVWHRKCKNNDGFQLVRQGDFLLDVPLNWRDHVKVVKGARKKNLPSFIETQEIDLEDAFDEMCGQKPRVRLDKEHRKLIDWLKDN